MVRPDLTRDRPDSSSTWAGGYAKKIDKTGYSSGGFSSDTGQNVAYGPLLKLTAGQAREGMLKNPPGAPPTRETELSFKEGRL